MIDNPGITRKLVIQEEEIDWEAVYRSELPHVYNYFGYRFNDDRLAEDLTAETFEKAWRSRQRYRKDLAAFSTWLFTIARNIAVDRLRRPQRETPLEELREVPGEASVESLIQDSEDLRHLHHLLAGLPERERDLVALKYGAGLTNREIARLTGLTESNVGTILHRTTLQLRKVWEEE